MIQFISSLRSFAAATLLFLSAGVIFLSCKKESHDSVRTPEAGLMVFNLAPDKNSVGFAISGNNLTNQPLVYTSYSGNYLSVFPGQRNVDAYDYYSSTGTIATTAGSFDSARYYSVFLVGAANHYRNVFVNDNFDSLSGLTGQAYIRYVNAIPDSVSSPIVSVTAGGNSVLNEVAAFGSVSQFVPVNAGDVSISIKNSNGIDASRTITTEQRKIYTILLAGVPGSGATPVEIKYITNGILDNAAAKASAMSGSSKIQ